MPANRSKRSNSAPLECSRSLLTEEAAMTSLLFDDSKNSSGTLTPLSANSSHNELTMVGSDENIHLSSFTGRHSVPEEKSSSSTGSRPSLLQRIRAGKLKRASTSRLEDWNNSGDASVAAQYPKSWKA